MADGAADAKRAAQAYLGLLDRRLVRGLSSGSQTERGAPRRRPLPRAKKPPPPWDQEWISQFEQPLNRKRWARVGRGVWVGWSHSGHGQAINPPSPPFHPPLLQNAKGGEKGALGPC